MKETSGENLQCVQEWRKKTATRGHALLQMRFYFRFPFFLPFSYFFFFLFGSFIDLALVPEETYSSALSRLPPLTDTFQVIEPKSRFTLHLVIENFSDLTLGPGSLVRSWSGRSRSNIDNDCRHY